MIFHAEIKSLPQAADAGIYSLPQFSLSAFFHPCFPNS